jgi:signal transduction histidine kinase
MLSCSNHLCGLIGQVLDLAKVEAGKMTFTYESVSLVHLVREVIDTVMAIAKSKRIEVTLQSGAQVDLVWADASRLKQILYNYLSNALKFTPTGGRVKVSVWAEDSETFRIDVEDSGLGIAPDDIPRLFSEFGQLGDTEKSKAGSGLGLAISKHIAEAQGGRVGVKSDVGGGSMFFVVLPRVPEGSAPSEIASASSHTEAPPAGPVLAERRTS